MKPSSKTKRKSINEYIGKLKKQNAHLTRALNEEKKITRRLLGSKLATQQKLDAIQKAYNIQLGAINDVTNFLKGTVNIFQQKADYLNDIRLEANKIIDECNDSCHTSLAVNNHFLKHKAPSTPTRQVVQPMVGGFTIQRPIVNLARLSFSNNRNNEIIRNNVQNVVSENDDEEIEDHSTNSSREREDSDWIMSSPVVRLYPLSIDDHRNNESRQENYTEDDDSEYVNDDDSNAEVEHDDDTIINTNPSVNNLQDITNIIQSTMVDNNNTEEMSSSLGFTTLDDSVIGEHPEHNGDVQT